MTGDKIPVLMDSAYFSHISFNIFSFPNKEAKSVGKEVDFGSKQRK